MAISHMGITISHIEMAIIIFPSTEFPVSCPNQVPRRPPVSAFSGRIFPCSCLSASAQRDRPPFSSSIFVPLEFVHIGTVRQADRPLDSHHLQAAFPKQSPHSAFEGHLVHCLGSSFEEDGVNAMVMVALVGFHFLPLQTIQLEHATAPQELNHIVSVVSGHSALCIFGMN